MRLFALRFLVIFALLPVALAAAGDSTTARFTAAGLAANKALWQAYVDDGRLVGLTTLIAHKGEIVQFETYGEQDREAADAMAKDTIFRIYSMTKPITGIALMMLWEEGKFKLDDPIADYMPEFRGLTAFVSENEDGSLVTEPLTRAVTIRDIMRHTGGFSYGIFSDTPVDKMYRDAVEGAGVSGSQELVNILGVTPLLVQPGTKWIYSLSVDIQSHLVEVLSGQPFDVYLKERIFGPLGMTDTDFFVPADKANRFVQIYNVPKEGPLKLIPEYADANYLTKPAWLSGGGGLVSTTLDYWRFAAMLGGNGTFDGVQIVKPETLAEMTRDQLPAGVVYPWGKGTGFGLDFSVVTDGAAAGEGFVTGDFAWGGMANTAFWVDPANDIVAVLMTNVLPSGAYPLRAEFHALIGAALVHEDTGASD